VFLFRTLLFISMAKFKHLSKEELLKLTETYFSFSGILQSLNLSCGSKNISKLKKLFLENNINYLHFNNQKKPLLEILVKSCPQCGKNFVTKKNKREKHFCSRNCANIFIGNKKDIQENRKSLWIQKNIKSFGKDNLDEFGHLVHTKICKFCETQFKTKAKQIKFCSRSCSSQFIWKNPTYRNQITKLNQIRCSSENERVRLRDIGRKGGFGNHGYINDIYYASNFERDAFKFLIDNNIKFEPHKNIINSTKVSDIFIPSQNLWIELDGINREKRKKWLKNEYKYWQEKLAIYDAQNLNYKIFLNIEEFKSYISQLFNIIFVT
jgi:hypothetical protein